MTLLEDKNAIVYGAAGNVGRAIAQRFAHEGARVFVTGRHPDRVDAVAQEIVAHGGRAEAAVVDALDADAVEAHADAVLRSAGSIDVSFNAIGISPVGLQGIPLTDLSPDAFARAIETYPRSHFTTARAAARRMVERRSGVILMHTPEPARLGLPLLGGMGPAWAAMEGLNRQLSAECAPFGVRAVCLRTTGMPETSIIDVVFGLHADAAGITREQFAAMSAGMTHRKRATTLDELAGVAAFVASDGAAAMTGTVANLTGGTIVD